MCRHPLYLYGYSEVPCVPRSSKGGRDLGEKMKECGLFLRVSAEAELAGIMAMLGLPSDFPFDEQQKTQEAKTDEQESDDREATD